MSRLASKLKQLSTAGDSFRRTRKSHGSQEIQLRRPIAAAERLRWLVEFAQPPSRPMTHHAVRTQIVTLGTHLREVVLRHEATGEIVDLRHPGADFLLRGVDAHKSLSEKLALLRGRIHKLLMQHLSHGGPRPQAQVRLCVTAHGDGNLVSHYETEDVRDAVAYVLVLELGEFGTRVRCCAESKCKRLFVRTRRQRYCSVKCRNRATFRRWYRRQRRVLPGARKTAGL
jgi:hypothetical protein